MRDNDILICVDSYKNRLISGRVFTKSGKGSADFENMVQLLKILQSIMDKSGYPEPYTVIKNFSSTKADSGAPAFTDGSISDLRGKAGTFLVKVVFRQNASWQGVINWIDGRKEESFRSALELIFLMDSALENED